MKTEEHEDFWERSLPPDEFERLLQQAIDELDGPEGDEMRAHMAWFKRRYPTALDRCRYSTRMYKQWMRTRGLAR